MRLRLLVVLLRGLPVNNLVNWRAWIGTLLICLSVVESHETSAINCPWKSISCTSLLNSKPLKWLSKYRPWEIARAEGILRKWRKMTLKEYRDFYKINPDAIVFIRIKDGQSRPIGVLGDVELFELDG